MQQLFAEMADTLPSTILYLCCSDDPSASLRPSFSRSGPPKTTEVGTTVIEQTMPVVHLVQALAEHDFDKTITLGIVTRGAQIVT
jgi:hypothetical protein